MRRMVLSVSAQKGFSVITSEHKRAWQSSYSSQRLLDLRLDCFGRYHSLAMTRRLMSLLILIAMAFSSSAFADKSNKDTKGKQSTNNLLKSYLDLVSFRHKVLSENVAN